VKANFTFTDTFAAATSRSTAAAVARLSGLPNRTTGTYDRLGAYFWVLILRHPLSWETDDPPILDRAFSWLCLASPAVGAGVEAASINNADFSTSKSLSEDKINALVVRVQVLLDRARFSPGEIDGKLGENAQKALKAFADAKGLAPNRPLTAEVWKALAATSSDAVIVDYKITKDDVKGPFLEKLPAKIEDMKDLAALSYTSPREALAEKFHMSEDLLEALNPGKNSIKPVKRYLSPTCRRTPRN